MSIGMTKLGVGLADPFHPLYKTLGETIMSRLPINTTPLIK